MYCLRLHASPQSQISDFLGSVSSSKSRQDSSVPLVPPPPTFMSNINASSMRGMVTSPHIVASQVGLDLLEAGGNAIEAAIAIANSLGVTYPHFCGLGGDAFLLIADTDGNVQSISGIGQSAADVSSYLQDGTPIPTRGPRSMLTTAGAVDAMGKAYDISRNQWTGKYRWDQLLEPAIALAENGFERTASEMFWHEFRRKEETLMPEIFAEPSHQYCKRPALAQSLKELATGGPRDFYEGQLAHRIAQGLQKVGSPITTHDLAKTQARVEVPLSISYRGGTLLTNRPPTQGITTLEIMGILENVDLQHYPESSADHFHLMVEAVKRAFIHRAEYVADPEYRDVPVEYLLSQTNLNQQVASIQLHKALPWPHTYQHGDTVYIGVVDQAGRAVSMLCTIYFDWGSGTYAGDTGILWHNRGAAFSLDPQHPNFLEANKRPFHTLNPGIYTRNGKPHILYGTQGADGQPQTLAALLTRLIDYKLDPYTALVKPRFLLGRTFSDSRDTLKIETDISPEVHKSLLERGHEISLVSAQSQLMGHPGVIVIDPNTGQMTGAHDPRSDGHALGL